MRKLKFLTLLLGWLLLSWSAKAQTIHFSEDFNTTAFGDIPTGWTLGDGGSMVHTVLPTTPDTTWCVADNAWRGNDLGDGNYLMIDSDGAGSSGTQNDTITSPAIDLSAITTPILLDFALYYRDYSFTNETLFVDVYDGTNWVGLDTFTTTTGSWANPFQASYDVTAYKSASFQFRFRYENGNWSYYAAIDQIQVYSPASYDLQAVASYLIDGTCDDVDTVALVVKNVGASNISGATIDFLYEVVGSGSPVTKNVTNYSLATNALDTIKFTANPLNITSLGTFQVKSWFQYAADGNNTNDTAYSPSYTYSTPITTYPIQVDFTGYTGSNLSTVFPGWYEANGPWGTTPVQGNSSWTRDDWLNNTSSPNGDAAKINLYSNFKDGEWIISPKFTVPTTNPKLRYDIGVTDYGQTNLTDSLGSDDSVLVAISVDCGNSWIPLKLYTRPNTPPDTGITEMIDLSAYAGQNVRIGFYATEGSVNDPQDVDVFLDNINIYPQFNNDVGVTNVSVKNSFISCAGTDNVVIVIENFGSATQTSIPVKYQVYHNGSPVGSVVSETASVNLPSGGTVTYQFTTPVSATTPGNYAIQAWTELTGDGYNSNDTTMSKTYEVLPHPTPTDATPWVEDFETFKVPDTLNNGWYMTSNSSYEWRVNTGSTPSSNTGPSGDHTSGSGKYMYTEASNGSTGDTAVLVSPCIDLNNITNPHLTWWYHLYGATIDSLSIEISTDDGMTWTQLKYYNGQVQAADTDPWQSDTIDISAYKNNTVRIRFVGFKGSSYTGDMAIDDVSIFNKVFSNDLAVTSITPSKTNACVGDTITVAVEVKNVGSVSVSGGSATLYANIGGNTSSTTISKPLVPNDTAMFQYTYIATAGGSVNMYAIVNLPSDMNNTNDSLGTSINVTDIQFTISATKDTVPKADSTCFSVSYTNPDSVVWNFPNLSNVGTLSGTSCVVVSTNAQDSFLVACATVYKNGCSAQACDTVLVDLTVGVSTLGLSQTLQVYPNPVKNAIKVAIKGQALVELYDTRGIKVYSGNVINETTIDVSNLSKGIYILKVIAGDEVRNIKIIKE